MLSWDEAFLFLRAGDDMRFATWPDGDFIRAGAEQNIPGYVASAYTPTPFEMSNPQWRRA